jgi:hypothetical protein
VRAGNDDRRKRQRSQTVDRKKKITENAQDVPDQSQIAESPKM